MQNFEIRIEGTIRKCDFCGTTSNGGLRLCFDGNVVIMTKRMIDVWVMHPELDFHLTRTTMRSGQEVTFLN